MRQAGRRLVVCRCSVGGRSLERREVELHGTGHVRLVGRERRQVVRRGNKVDDDANV
jgi:hypothetical protein